MAVVSDDRWTCPYCHRTVVISGSQADVRACITAVQQRHSAGHKAAADILTHIPVVDLPAPGPRRGRRRPRS